MAESKMAQSRAEAQVI